ncbi:hypothetical protein NIES4101_42280 [Calothrix sp. NIES-4101]|nr:hypothetical protein NIES4101_42280 [Calothrix sp. NIES-4101]
MKNLPKIIIFGIAVSLFIVPLATAQSVNRERYREPVFPYLLDHQLDRQQVETVIRVRCLPIRRNQKYPSGNADNNRRLIRDRLLRPNQANEILIDVEGFCRDVKIRVNEPTNDLNYTFDENGEYEDNWSNRQGSGWQWLLRHR